MHIAKSTLLGTNNKQYGGGGDRKWEWPQLFPVTRTVSFQTPPPPPKLKILDET